MAKSVHIRVSDHIYARAKELSDRIASVHGVRPEFRSLLDSALTRGLDSLEAPTPLMVDHAPKASGK